MQDELNLAWEDCETLANSSLGPVSQFSMDSNSIYQMGFQPDQQLDPAASDLAQPPIPHSSTSCLASLQQSSTSPDSNSSPCTAQNGQSHSSSTSSPLDVQIKPDPYVNQQFEYNTLTPEIGFNQQNDMFQQNFTTQEKKGKKSTKGFDKIQLDTTSAAKGDSNSNEDEDLSIKRKAQNRAAQRAFRERKEQRVRELEQKISEIEKEKLKLSSENERLRKENTAITTENQVLLATSEKGPYNPPPEVPLRAQFPVHTFNSLLLGDHVVDPEHASKPATEGGDDPSEVPSYVVYEKKAGDVMLGAGAVWEHIMDAPDPDEIDVENVMKLLKGKEVCDGFGPVFRESDVELAIQKSRH